MLNLKVPKITMSMSFFKSKSFLLLVVAAVLIGVSVYIFKNYISKKINPDYVDNNEFNETREFSNGDKEATLYLFHVNWCMYCKKAMPEWLKFKNDYNEKTINGYKLYMKDYECSDDDDAEISSLLDKYEIDGYPTIILVKDGVPVKFEAKPTYDTLEEFVKTM
jgi:thiol-disulfide isomerase/thioredoxin